MMGKRKLNTRTDEDGDLVMDVKSQGGDRISKHRGRGNRHLNNSRSPVRNHLNSHHTQREILRQLGSTSKLKEAPQRHNQQRRLKEIVVTGWTKSKAALNEDGGVSDIIGFLERRGTLNIQKWAASKGTNVRSPVKIKKYRIEGNELVISVSAEEATSFLRLDGYAFAGANIKVKPAPELSLPGEAKETATEGTDYRQLLQQVLNRRYNADLKLLDLSNLSKDPDLNTVGVFDAATTKSKLFPALMKLCDGQFSTAEEKRNTIQSVTLASNDLTSVTPVTTLAQTFPDLQNLDLSNNSLNDIMALSPWRHKFRHLKYLIISGNPMENNSEHYATELLKWYRSLRFLNGLEVRQEKDLEDDDLQGLKEPLPIRIAHFRDEGQIAETFIKNFFVGFDRDRAGLVSYYYDAGSEFSFAINTQALRDPSSISSGEVIPQKWDAYIKRSRNLRKVSLLPARLSRSYQGAEEIREAFASMPITKHPALAEEPHKWLIECISQPGIPDPTGGSDAGVGGFLITVHGEFTELQESTEPVQKKRSFDRTFVLGPGGPNGVRVVSELLTFRAYGGYALFQGEPLAAETQEGGIGQDQMVAELSKITGMKLDFSRQCLEESGWSPEKAMVTFEAAKATLPREVFL